MDTKHTTAAPAQAQRAPSEETGRSPASAWRIPFTSLAVPAVMAAQLDSINGYLEEKRQKTLEVTPTFIVNNSSNIIGALDLLGEMMVFKATGSNLLSKGSEGKPLRYLLDPPVNLYRSVLSRASFDVSAKDLLNPSFYHRYFSEFADLEKASAKDLVRGRLINRWQARAMFCSMLGMTASALIPQQKDSPEETLQMGQMWQEHPMQYVGTRFQQALWPPGWGEHKTQFAGLAKTITGVFSFLSSYRNVAEGVQYFHNPAHGITAAITTIGGLQLMLGIDKEQAWQNYGATSWMRLPFLSFSIAKRFFERDKRAVWYAGSVGMFQFENTFAYFIGGAEKDENGTIIDKKSLREQAKNHSHNSAPALFSSPSATVAAPSINGTEPLISAAAATHTPPTLAA